MFSRKQIHRTYNYDERCVITLTNKLEYTTRMAQIDRLWQTQDHNPHTMIDLFDQIITNAKRRGFNGFVAVRIRDKQVNADIYACENDYRRAQLGIDVAPNDTATHCIDLIRKLEEHLNIKTNI